MAQPLAAMAKEALQLLAELRGCEDAAPPESALLHQPLIIEVERLLIVLRLNRVMSWITLQNDIESGRCRLEGIALTLNALFDCPSLNREAEDLPERLDRLSKRSRDLFERAKASRFGF